MKKINQFFRDNLFYLVIISIFLGFLLGWLFPQVVSSLKAFIVPILFLMIYVMIVPMEFKELINVRKYKKELILGLFAILILAPLVAYLINFIFPEKYNFSVVSD